MTTTQQYEMILATMPEDLPSRIMSVLEKEFNKNPGKNLSRQEMVYLVHNIVIPKDKLANSTEDRQNRETIEALQLQGYPIISSSGKAGGYRLAVDQEDSESYINELESRRKNLELKIAALRSPRKSYVYQHVLGV